MDQFKFEIEKKSGGARAGVIHTPHGKILTPAFSPVATRASVRGLSPEDINNSNSQVVLANTYHLYLSPGTDVLDEFGGFGPFMNWYGPTITDSGGYQVSFLWNMGEGGDSNRSSKVKITEEGAKFRSHIDGSIHLISPEKSMQIQASLGADIIMAFDQPLGKSMSEKKQTEAFYRTIRWEERSMAEWTKLQKNRKNKQALYGIVQGETDIKKRIESLKFILEMDFPGIAIGGETIGSDPSITASALDTIVELLPDNKPVHALGLGGGPEGIFEAVDRGIDTFDNTSVTRLARTGYLFIYPEDGGNTKNKFRFNIKKEKYKEDKSPISKMCQCYTCQNYSKAYVRHLLVNHEFLGIRLTSIHNITYINDVVSNIRKSILRGEFNQLKNEWLNCI